MTGVIGFIVGYGEGGETEDLGDEFALSLVGGTVEAIGVPLISALVALLNMLLTGMGMKITAPAFATMNVSFTLGALVLGILGLFISGAVGSFVGVQIRHLAQWARKVW